jgi:phosphate transport system permease protein
VYLSEYAPKKFRYYVKPLLEVLAAIPTVVYGFFALTVVTPFLQNYIPNLAGLNALSAGLVMGIMIIPMISSLSEDALYAVPKSLREGAYGMGSTRLQTSFRVILPAASSGIMVSIILGFARAVGETMIVTVAAGNMANLTADPRETVATITAFIVNMSTGDVQQDSIEYQTIFAAGVTLFVFTFILNSVSFYIKKRFRAKYD